MPSSIIKRLRKIEYQIKKSVDTEVLSDVQLLYMAQGIINASINDEVKSEIVDDFMPVSMLGVDLDWTAGSTENDTIVALSKGSHILAQDLLVENERFEGYDIETDTTYLSATMIAQNINDGPVTEYEYTFIDKAQAILDGTAIIDAING